MGQTNLEHALAQEIGTAITQFVDVPEPEIEHRFHDTRKWRFDFAWPDLMLALEAEGGTWTRGRHTRGQGFEDDCEKYNTAVIQGWRVLRFTRGQIEDGSALYMLLEIFKFLGMEET
jgi:very-short-patch-repair endonuclease